MNSSGQSEHNFYHEKQERQMCLLHTINNLMQKRAFTKEDLDRICLTYALLLIFIAEIYSFYYID